MRWCVDVHNHSCLSPCASDHLLPSILALEAYEKGINLLALSDHNSGQNLPPFKEACEIVGITPIFGIEVTTIEEAHLLLLFETLQIALEFSSWIESLLPPLKNKPTLFGNQLVTNVDGTAVTECPLFLSGATSLSFDELVREALKEGALVIPAHIDRPYHSVLSQLGFLPPLAYSAVEVIRYPPAIDIGSYTPIQSSDAHYIEHIGRRYCYFDSPLEGFAALKEALEMRSLSYLM